MAKRYSIDHPHPSVREELEEVYISGDGREVVKGANAILERASLSRSKRVANFIMKGLSAVAQGGARMNGAGHLLDAAKRDEDELNANQ
jgi:CMP-N-acetylneuraminic acid synthetase